MLSAFKPAARLQTAYRRRFLENRADNLFMGSFTDLIAARAYVPQPAVAMGGATASRKSALTKKDRSGSLQIRCNDYPALFWIGRSVAEGMRNVIDLGGYIGTTHDAFERLLGSPRDLNWKICDVTGGRVGPDAGDCDLLYLAGSLPYLPMRLGEILALLPVKPKRIVLNDTAVHPERTIYTLNSSRFGVRPCRIQHHDELLAELTDAGYRWRDHWRNEGPTIEVPFVEGGAQPYYAGGCFDRN